MTTTFEIKIKRLEVQTQSENLQNIVVGICYELIANCAETNKTERIIETIPAPKPDSGEFVEYDVLTLSDVLRWVTSSKKFEESKTKLQNIVEYILPQTPVIEIKTDFPWNK